MVNNENQTPAVNDFRELREVVEGLQDIILTLEERTNFVRAFRAKAHRGEFAVVEVSTFFDLEDFKVKPRNGNCVGNMIIAVTPEFEAFVLTQRHKYTSGDYAIEDFKAGKLDFFAVAKAQQEARENSGVDGKRRLPGRPRKVK
jgi:hypothetical protein